MSSLLFSFHFLTIGHFLQNCHNGSLFTFRLDNIEKSEKKHHSDQMFEGFQVSKVILCVQNSKMALMSSTMTAKKGRY